MRRKCQKLLHAFFLVSLIIIDFSTDRMNIYVMVYDVQKLRILNTCTKELRGVFSLIS
jgi:hypothetical protein